ncbi:MAG: trypsin-like peptidase domain-containing protein [Planctomycetaceae bacterium]
MAGSILREVQPMFHQQPDRTRNALLVILAWGSLSFAFYSRSGSAQDAKTDPLAGNPIVAIEQTFIDVIDKCDDSIVSIARIQNDGMNRREVQIPMPERGPDELFSRELWDPSHPDFIPMEYGTGIIVAPTDRPDERYILTNYHVVEGGPISGKTDAPSEYQLYLRFANRRGCRGTIRAADPRSDLAVIDIHFEELEIKPADLIPLSFPENPTFRKGQIVVLLGNPFAIARDGSASASWGILSNIARLPHPLGPLPLSDDERKKETIHHYGTLLQADARMPLGSSGGAWVNLRGELIGVMTSLAALAGYESNSGYAIPMNSSVRRIVDSLLSGYEVEYGFLGVQPENVLPAELKDQPLSHPQPSAAVAMRVYPNSPAAQGGMNRGDYILSVNRVPILDRNDLWREIGLLGPESQAEIVVWRPSTRQELQLLIKLGKWPVYDDEGLIATQSRIPRWRGLLVDHPTGRFKYVQWPFRYPAAVLITDVAADTPAATAELHAGDLITHVNQKPVQTPNEFRAAIEQQEGEIQLTLTDGRRITLMP